MANETNETAAGNAGDNSDNANTSDKKPEGAPTRRINSSHLIISVLAIALIIGALVFWGVPGTPTGKVLEPAVPNLTLEQITEFNGIVEECNQYFVQRDNRILNCLDNYSVALKNANLTDEVIAQYANTTIRDDRPPLTTNLRGILFQKLKMFNESKQEFEKALAFNPNDTGIIVNYAYLLDENGFKNESKQEFEKALAIEPNNTIVLVNYANLLAKMGLKTEAEQEYRKAIELKPNDTETYRFFGQFLFTIGRYAEGKEMIDKSGYAKAL